VLIVDDHPAFNEGLREQLERAGFRVVGVAGTAAEAFASVGRLRPDLVILDLELPDGSGIEVARRIAEADPAAAIVMMSAFGSAENVSAALAVGARGFVVKTADDRTLLHALQAALEGATVVQPGSWEKLHAHHDELSDREFRMLNLIARGRTNHEIAQELHLAPKTIEVNVARLTKKLGARNRTHAATIAVARRLVEPASLLIDHS
jgi:DNA-binding NarL/FixJ family response regulator